MKTDKERLKELLREGAQIMNDYQEEVDSLKRQLSVADERLNTLHKAGQSLFIAAGNLLSAVEGLREAGKLYDRTVVDIIQAQLSEEDITDGQ